MRWAQAVKLWNTEEHTVSTPHEVYAVPRKGSEPYNEVRMLMKKPVAEAVKIADISKTSKIEAPVAPTGMPPKPPMPIKLKLKKAQAPATVSPVEIKETITDEIKEGTAPKSIKLKLKKATSPVEIKEEIKEEAPAPKSIKLNLKKAVPVEEKPKEIKPKKSRVSKEESERRTLEALMAMAEAQRAKTAEEEKSAKYEIIPLGKSKPASEIFKVNPKTSKIQTLREFNKPAGDRHNLDRMLKLILSRRTPDSKLYDTPEGIYMFLNPYIKYISWEQDVKDLAVPLPEDFKAPDAKKIVKQYVQDVFPENDLFTVSIGPFNETKWNATRKSGGISDTTIGRFNAGDMLLFTPTAKGEKDRKERIESGDAGFWTRLADDIYGYGKKAGYED